MHIHNMCDKRRIKNKQKVVIQNNVGHNLDLLVIAIVGWVISSLMKSLTFRQLRFYEVTLDCQTVFIFIVLHRLTEGDQKLQLVPIHRSF